MICATMLSREGTLCGFNVQGHSGSAVSGSDIVCAAVSSAAYMAANTITEIIGDNADIEVDDAKMHLTVTAPSDETIAVLAGLRLHLEGLMDQYPKNINVISEV